MKIKIIIKEYATTISIILVILITAILSFTDLINDKDVLRYLLFADVGLAINVFLATLKNEKNILAIKEPSSARVTRQDHYKLLNKAAIGVNKKILIMTIDPALSRNIVKSIAEREIYYESIKEIVCHRKDVIVERIYGLPIDNNAREDRKKWIQKDLDMFKNYPNYHMYIFDWKRFNKIPIPLSLQIVDDTFVGLVNMQQDSDGIIGGGEDLCITDSNVVRHLTLYYNEIRSKCEPLKIANEVKQDVYNKIV